MCINLGLRLKMRLHREINTNRTLKASFWYEYKKVKKLKAYYRLSYFWFFFVISPLKKACSQTRISYLAVLANAWSGRPELHTSLVSLALNYKEQKMKIKSAVLSYTTGEFKIGRPWVWLKSITTNISIVIIEGGEGDLKIFWEERFLIFLKCCIGV